MLCSTAQVSAVNYPVSKGGKVAISERTKKDYAVMIKSVRKGYKQLPLEGKYLYEILIEYDYADEITGLCKGYVFPDPKKTLTQDCNMSYRTICRQLERLEKVKLIKRIPRQNRGPLIVLLDIPDEQLSTYRNERRMPKMATVYNKDYENRRSNNKQLQYSLEKIKRYEARNDVVVFHLISLGYKPEQAVNDFMEFGRGELQQQIENLYAYLRCGKVFGSYARWLNWAIRSRYRVNLVALASLQAEGNPKQACQEEGEWLPMESDDPYEANTLHWRPKGSSQEIQQATNSQPVDPLDFHTASHEAQKRCRHEDVVVYEPEAMPFSIPKSTPQIGGIDIRKDTELLPHLNDAAPPLSLSFHFPDHTRPASINECGQEKTGGA
jgi:hypothetical protein